MFSILAVIGALATFAITSNADAFSVSPVPDLRSDVTLIAGGCGVGFHRGPYGGCRPNVVGYPAVGYGGGAYYRGRISWRSLSPWRLSWQGLLWRRVPP